MPTPLEIIIKQKIVRDGPMDIGTYMRYCLIHPEHGYYTAQDDVLGARGDFTTAPEISQLFGEMIGFWIADLWGQMGKPTRFILAELGPGKGTLMADAIRILDRIPGATQAAQIHLVEVSEKLIAHQAQALHGHDVTWHDRIEDLPDDLPLIVINNEFFDALPVQVFVHNGQEWGNVVVALDANGDLVLGQAKVALQLPVTGDDPNVFEASVERDIAAQILYTRIAAQGGAVLTIDYGYDTPQAASTVQAVKDHQSVDILTAPGECDVTALVDFARLATLAQAEGLNVAGPVGQGTFLQNLGIDARAAKVGQSATPTQHEDILSGLHRLTHPDQMGTLFKVLCVYTPAFLPLQGGGQGGGLRPAGFEA